MSAEQKCDSAKKGGEKCREKNGKAFYSRIGKKGGMSTLASNGTAFYRDIGKKGGPKGGNATKEKYGVAFYARIGALGGRKVKTIIEAGKKALAEAEETIRNESSQHGKRRASPAKNNAGQRPVE
jgi:general stress protein YciG